MVGGIRRRMSGRMSMGRGLSRRALFTEAGVEVASVLDASRVLGVTYAKVQNHVLRGRITPYAVVGRMVLIELEEARKALGVSK